MQSFQSIYRRAAKRKGGEAQLQKLLDTSIKTPRQLKSIKDDRALATITEFVFKAGFVWKVIDHKWPNFEQAFWNFNVARCAHISADDIDLLLKNDGIIRNLQKIKTVPINALLVQETAKQYGSFGAFLAQWPEDDFVGLLDYLNKQGDRLGSRTAQYILRFLGKDGFVLGQDGVGALIEAAVVDKEPTSKTALRKVQQAFNQWRDESGKGYTEISKVLAFSWGSN